MALLVWFTTGVAIWHLAVFVPDRFWGGIIGAFGGASMGAIVTGALAQAALGDGLGTTNLATMLYAVPGSVLGLAAVYYAGIRSETEAV